jgi:rubrerythrin
MDDTISRQAAIDAVKRLSLGETDATRLAMRIEDYLERLASAQPERMKGKWIDNGQYGDNFPHHAWLCSECGEGVIEIDTPWYKFCPNCGADMRGEEH